MAFTSEAAAANLVVVDRNISDSVSRISVAILRDEVTVDALVADQKAIGALIAAGRHIVAALNSCERISPLDPDSVLDALLALTGNAIEVGIEILERARGAALKEPRLGGAQKDAVVSKYNGLMERMVVLSDVTRDMQWAILNHDADLAKDTASFADAAAAVEHLRRL